MTTDLRPAICDLRPAFEVMPSLDIIGGRVVRLSRGDFGAVTVYGEVEEVVDRMAIPAGTRVHVVDLEGSRDGKPVADDVGFALEVGSRARPPLRAGGPDLFPHGRLRE